MKLSSLSLRQRVALLRWVLPLAFALSAGVYQLGLARWVHDQYGHNIHYGVEILFYSTAGLLLTYWALPRLGKWLEEKEGVEIKARASEQRLASITSASADAILGLDSQGRIESWNHGAELIFGYTTQEILERPLTDLLGRGEAAEVELAWLGKSLGQAGLVRRHETNCVDANGR